MKSLTLFMALLVAGSANAELKILGDNKVQRDSLVRLFAKGVPDKAGLLWKIYPAKGVDKADAPKGKLQFVAPPGEYVVTLIAVSLAADGSAEIEEAELTVTVGAGKPPADPPIDPPPVKPGQIYLMLVRQDGPAQPSFTQIVSDPAWDQLRAAGCLVKDFTLSRARELGAEIPAGRNLPLVVTLKVKSDGSGADQFKLPDGSPWIRDLPTTADGILKLTEGTK